MVPKELRSSFQSSDVSRLRGIDEGLIGVCLQLFTCNDSGHLHETLTDWMQKTVFYGPYDKSRDTVASPLYIQSENSGLNQDLFSSAFISQHRSSFGWNSPPEDAGEVLGVQSKEKQPEQQTTNAAAAAAAARSGGEGHVMYQLIQNCSAWTSLTSISEFILLANKQHAEGQ